MSSDISQASGTTDLSPGADVVSAISPGIGAHSVLHLYVPAMTSGESAISRDALPAIYRMTAECS